MNKTRYVDAGGGIARSRFVDQEESLEVPALEMSVNRYICIPTRLQCSVNFGLKHSTLSQPYWAKHRCKTSVYYQALLWLDQLKLKDGVCGTKE